MALNSLGGEARQPATVPVTLPVGSLPDLELESEVREAVHFIRRRRLNRPVQIFRLGRKRQTDTRSASARPPGARC